MSASAAAVPPLRAALSAPAIAALLLSQAERLLAPGPLAAWLALEAGFAATAFVLARRWPRMAWSYVPAMWAGVALGALADALWLGGDAAQLPALLGAAAPALVAGFAVARSLPPRTDGQ